MDTLQAAAHHSDYHSPQRWYITDQWDQQMEALRDENADLRKLHRDLIVTVQQLNEERDDLKQAYPKFTTQMSQLEEEVKELLSWRNQQSQFPQILSTLPVSGPSKTRDRSRPVPAPRRPRVIEPVSNAKNAQASHEALEDRRIAESSESSEDSSSQESHSSSVDDGM